MVTRVESLQDLREAVRSADRINVVGENSKAPFRLTTADERSEPIYIGLKGIVEFSPADQVVVVRAGTLIEDLLPELADKGQTIPIPVNEEFWPHVSGFPRTVGGAISMNLPHGAEAQCGSWRDWILGLTVVLSDGTIAHSGSRAVKNVAGYDAHKLFVGARGTLGVIAEVILKTFPVDALPSLAVEARSGWTDGPLWIQRTLPSDFREAVKTAPGTLLAVDWASSALWCHMGSEVTGPRFTADWVVRSGPTRGEISRSDDVQAGLMRKAKEIFDPTNKFNPGEFGS
jgi:glycolate oxidase FAD binding subunit